MLVLGGERVDLSPLSRGSVVDFAVGWALLEPALLGRFPRQVRAGLHISGGKQVGDLVADKPWASVDGQIDILTRHDLTDTGDCRYELATIGSYRLSGFSYPLR